MKRRVFLRGVAGAALAAPFLSSLEERVVQAQAVAKPRRLVIFYTNNGCLTNRWFPKVEDGPITAESLMGTTLQPLAPLANKLLFPRGLAMFPRGQVTVNGVTYFDPHDQGMGSKLTCAPIDSSGEHYALSRSLDHVAAELVNPGAKTPLVLSVGFASSNVKQVVSYKAPLEPFTPETRPSNVFSGLTGLLGSSSGGQMTEADYRVKRGKSIIDLVRADIDTLKRQRMSNADKKRLDDWLALLRQTEVPIVSAACDDSKAASLGVTGTAVNEASGGRAGGLGGGSNLADAFTKAGDMMMNLIALTMMCDTNRVILLQWPGFVKFTWDGMNHEYDHHGLSHRNGSAAVGGTCVTGVIDSIHQIDTWYAGRYTKLVNLIQSITEGDLTMLDQSMVMWLPELSDGNAHNNNNLPIVIAGSGGGFLKQGVSVNLDGKALGTGNSEASCVNGSDVGFGTGSQGGNVPLNKLYVTLLNALGAKNADGSEITQFGVVDSNQLDQGITKPGGLEALRASA